MKIPVKHHRVNQNEVRIMINLIQFVAMVTLLVVLLFAVLDDDVYPLWLDELLHYSFSIVVAVLFVSSLIEMFFTLVYL